ncbi:MAG: YihY/virulence factor BrkB family protein [Paracoccaceae bacterium]
MSLNRYFVALRSALERFNRKNGFVMSSHIAMSLMLALFPFVLFTVALAGTLADIMSRDVAMDDMIELVFGSWPDQVADPIESELYAVLATSSSKLVTLGGVLTLYFASNGVDAIRIAMSQAYREVDPRPYWQKRGLCLLFVLAAGAGILAVAILELALPLYTEFLKLAFPDQVQNVFSADRLSSLISAATPLLAIIAAHLWLPGTRHSLRDILPGVVLTSVLCSLLGWGFAVYVSSFASYSATYAGLAGAMAALIFLYFNAAIIILGAEFNGALLRQGDVEKPANT